MKQFVLSILAALIVFTGAAFAAGTVKVLPLLNAGDTATPAAINDNDEVVGEECTPAPQTCTGVVWTYSGSGFQVASIASMSWRSALAMPESVST